MERSVFVFLFYIIIEFSFCCKYESHVAESQSEQVLFKSGSQTEMNGGS